MCWLQDAVGSFRGQHLQLIKTLVHVQTMVAVLSSGRQSWDIVVMLTDAAESSCVWSPAGHDAVNFIKLSHLRLCCCLCLLPLLTAGLPQCVEYHNMCRADSSLVFCKGYNDAAKRVADSVLKNKGADADSKQDSAPAKSGSTAASSSMLLAALGVVAAVLVL